MRQVVEEKSGDVGTTRGNLDGSLHNSSVLIEQRRPKWMHCGELQVPQYVFKTYR